MGAALARGASGVGMVLQAAIGLGMVGMIMGVPFFFVVDKGGW